MLNLENFRSIQYIDHCNQLAISHILKHMHAGEVTQAMKIKSDKVVKSGQITDPDRLFNIIADEIYNKYTNIGIELGLTFSVLENELETGVIGMLQGSKKALKMLHLWRNSVKKDDLTYSVLAAALEKHGFGHCADKYCYTI